ncbi:MAG: hypothetical protein ACLTYN_12830 [Dysosmobacter welbionis]
MSAQLHKLLDECLMADAGTNECNLFALDQCGKLLLFFLIIRFLLYKYKVMHYFESSHVYLFQSVATGKPPNEQQIPVHKKANCLSLLSATLWCAFFDMHQRFIPARYRSARHRAGG